MTDLTWTGNVQTTAEALEAARQHLPRCACGKPATCIGKYEAMEAEVPACDDCCGHGCEDGQCRPLQAPSDPVLCSRCSSVIPEGDGVVGGRDDLLFCDEGCCDAYYSEDRL